MEPSIDQHFPALSDTFPLLPLQSPPDPLEPGALDAPLSPKPKPKSLKRPLSLLIRVLVAKVG